MPNSRGGAVKNHHVMIRYGCTLMCGCKVEPKTLARAPQAFADHNAKSQRFPLQCPKCQQDTYARRGKVCRA